MLCFVACQWCVELHCLSVSLGLGFVYIVLSLVLYVQVLEQLLWLHLFESLYNFLCLFVMVCLSVVLFLVSCKVKNKQNSCISKVLTMECRSVPSHYLFFTVPKVTFTDRYHWMSWQKHKITNENHYSSLMKKFIDYTKLSCSIPGDWQITHKQLL